jgi:mannose-6-phosphate isomerase
MESLRNRIQPYPWGSHSAIARLRGEGPTEKPEAELWVGAHPLAPSQILRDGSWQGLDAVIKADSIAELGAAASLAAHASGEGARLPFLVKILAAGRPLSLQVHPDHAQARTGFARENGAGLPLDARHRTYRDASAKPEILVALSRFEGLCGFRPVHETIELLDTLALPQLAHCAAQLRQQPDAGGLREVTTDLLRLDAITRAELVASLVDRAVGYVGPLADLVAWLPRLATLFPNDVGIVISLLLNHVVLEPGQALFLGAGNVHAYLHGLGVEVMANSDNVLRAGFTDKHLDVGELLAIADFTPLADPLFRAEPAKITASAVVSTFRPPVQEFVVDQIRLDGDLDLDGNGPSIILVTDGSISGLGPTQAAFCRPGRIHLSGFGTAWRVTTPDPPAETSRP